MCLIRCVQFSPGDVAIPGAGRLRLVALTEERNSQLEVSRLHFLISGLVGSRDDFSPDHVLGLFRESSETFLRQMTPAMYPALELEHPQQINAVTAFRFSGWRKMQFPLLFCL